MKVAIIGAGNMGGALARGLARGSMIPTDQIVVSNPSKPKLEALKEEFPEIQVTTDNGEAVETADLVVLAVKPWKVEEVLREITPRMDYTRQAVASLVGGLGIAQLSQWLDDGRGVLPSTYLIIPNTAIATGSSMTFLTSVRSTARQDEFLLGVFNELGAAMWVEEGLIPAGTSLASCGIAFALRYIRAAMEGGGARFPSRGGQAGRDADASRCGGYPLGHGDSSRGGDRPCNHPRRADHPRAQRHGRGRIYTQRDRGSSRLDQARLNRNYSGSTPRFTGRSWNLRLK